MYTYWFWPPGDVWRPHGGAVWIPVCYPCGPLLTDGNPLLTGKVSNLVFPQKKKKKTGFVSCQNKKVRWTLKKKIQFPSETQLQCTTVKGDTPSLSNIPSGKAPEWIAPDGGRRRKSLVTDPLDQTAKFFYKDILYRTDFWALAKKILWSIFGKRRENTSTFSPFLQFF